MLTHDVDCSKRLLNSNFVSINKAVSGRIYNIITVATPINQSVSGSDWKVVSCISQTDFSCTPIITAGFCFYQVLLAWTQVVRRSEGQRIKDEAVNPVWAFQTKHTLLRSMNTGTLPLTNQVPWNVSTEFSLLRRRHPLVQQTRVSSVRGRSFGLRTHKYYSATWNTWLCFLPSYRVTSDSAESHWSPIFYNTHLGICASSSIIQYCDECQLETLVCNTQRNQTHSKKIFITSPAVLGKPSTKHFKLFRIALATGYKIFHNPSTYVNNKNSYLSTHWLLSGMTWASSSRRPKSSTLEYQLQ